MINTTLWTLIWFQISAAVASQHRQTGPDLHLESLLGCLQGHVRCETSEKTAWKWTLQNRTIALTQMETVAPCSWRSGAEPVCTHVSLKPAVKALEFLASGNANARAEITALSEITGGSWKSYLMQEWRTWRAVEDCMNECVCVLAMGEK